MLPLLRQVPAQLVGSSCVCFLGLLHDADRTKPPTAAAYNAGDGWIAGSLLSPPGLFRLLGGAEHAALCVNQGLCSM